VKSYLCLLPVVFSSLLAIGACSDDDARPNDDPNEGGAGPGPGPGGQGGSSHAGASQTAGTGNGGSRHTGGSTSETGGTADEGGSGGAEPASTTPHGPCDMSERVGRFSVEAQKDFGVVQGSILEGLVPTAIPELIGEQDGCKVYKRRNLACSPACVGAETCGEDGSCIPYPRQLGVGTVTITGLTKPTAMDPQKPGAVYFAPGADNPPFEPGSQIVLSAAGSEGHAPFELVGIGSEPLEEAPIWILQEGRDLELEWSALSASADVKTSVFVELTIDQHGNSPLSLACELEDTGHGTIPSALIDQLITSGVSGFPNGRILRRTADNVKLDVGCVELSVGSTFSAKVSVSGFTPCMKEADCPDGQTCNMQLERCE
jgi:hypothetical protein